MANPAAAPAADAPHLEGLPPEYTNAREELDALLAGVGLVDRSPMGRLRFDGADAQDLLNRLSTNDLEVMEPGDAVFTVLTSNKGRIIDLLLVLKHEDRLTVVANPDRVEAVTDHVDFFNFGEDVEITDQSENTAMLGLSGPGTPALIDAAVGPDAWPEQPGTFAEVAVGELSALLVRTDFLRHSGADLIVSAAERDALRQHLLDAGAAAIGAEALETARILQGVPASGSELSEDRNPHEALLADYLSFTKGCYVGQEVVIRLHTYDKVQRYLSTLAWEPSDAVSVGDLLYVEGKRVGEVTSAAVDIRNGAGIGLGYVRKAQADPGTTLEAGSPEGPAQVRITEPSATP